jgi:hypothetical protein
MWIEFILQDEKSFIDLVAQQCEYTEYCYLNSVLKNSQYSKFYACVFSQLRINMTTHWEYKLLKLRYSYTDVVCVSPPHSSKSLVPNNSSHE